MDKLLKINVNETISYWNLELYGNDRFIKMQYAIDGLYVSGQAWPK